LELFNFLEKAPLLSIYTGIIASIVSLIIYISQLKEMTKKRLMFYSTNTFLLIGMSISGFIYFIWDAFYLIQLIVILYNSYLVLLAFYKVVQIETSEKHFLSEYSDYFDWLIKHSKIEKVETPEELKKYFIKNIFDKKEQELKSIEVEGHKRIEKVNHSKIIEIIEKNTNKEEKEAVYLMCVVGEVPKGGVVLQVDEKYEKVAYIIESKKSEIFILSDKLDVYEEFNNILVELSDALSSQNKTFFLKYMKVLKSTINKIKEEEDLKPYLTEILYEVYPFFYRAATIKDRDFYMEISYVIDKIMVIAFDKRDFELFKTSLYYMDYFYDSIKNLDRKDQVYIWAKLRITWKISDFFRWGKVNQLKEVKDQEMMLKFISSIYGKINNTIVKIGEGGNKEELIDDLLELIEVLFIDEMDEEIDEEVDEEIEKIRFKCYYYLTYYFNFEYQGVKKEEYLKKVESKIPNNKEELFEKISYVFSSKESFDFRLGKEKIHSHLKSKVWNCDERERIIKTFIVLLKYKNIYNVKELKPEYKNYLEGIIKYLNNNKEDIYQYINNGEILRLRDSFLSVKEKFDSNFKEKLIKAKLALGKIESFKDNLLEVQEKRGGILSIINAEMSLEAEEQNFDLLGFDKALPKDCFVDEEVVTYGISHKFERDFWKGYLRVINNRFIKDVESSELVKVNIQDVLKELKVKYKDYILISSQMPWDLFEDNFVNKHMMNKDELDTHTAINQFMGNYKGIPYYFLNYQAEGIYLINPELIKLKHYKVEESPDRKEVGILSFELKDISEEKGEPLVNLKLYGKPKFEILEKAAYKVIM